MLEEAGLVVSRLVSLGKVFPAPGWDIEFQEYFIAYCKSEVFEQPQDNSDNIERVKLSIEEVFILLQSREIKDLKTRCILYDAFDYLKKL